MGLHVARCLFLLLMAPAVAGRCGDVDCTDGFEVVFDANYRNYPNDRFTPVASPKCNEKITYAEANTGAPSIYFPPVSGDELRMLQSKGGAQDQTPMSKQLLLLMLVAATMATMKPMTTMMVMALLAVVLMLAPPVASFIDYDATHYLLVMSNPDAPENQGCNTRLQWIVMGYLNGTSNKFIPAYQSQFVFRDWTFPLKENDDPAVDNRYQFRIYSLPRWPQGLNKRFRKMKFNLEKVTNFDLVGQIEHHDDVDSKPARSFQFMIDKDSEMRLGA